MGNSFYGRSAASDVEEMSSTSEQASSKKRSFYLTTTLPYVNDKPHIGFALEIVQADIIARYHKLMGDEVFFNTGTDEHGQKIFQKAKEEGRDVQEYVDHFAEEFKKLRGVLNLSYDAFIRTTDAHHVEAAQELWRRCEKDIYKKKYKGLYCVGDEAFIKESELVNGKCPNHPTMEPIEIEEENYFFRLSAYQEKLETYLSKEGVIVPEWRRLEALQFLKGGLEDFSVSRVKEKMAWGVPVPGDDTQVMYVWFDALTNYISTLGWPEDADGNYEKFWEKGETLQLAGKDQVRFQSVMWQAMLMSAGLANTRHVFYHGFITSGGQKMSKSLGNVIDPIAIVDEYGADALRHFLAQHIHPYEDSDFTMERFEERHGSDLVDGLGNLVARTMQLSQTHLDNPVSKPVDFLDDKEKTDYHIPLAIYRVDQASDYVFRKISETQEQIAKEEAFKLIKTDPEEAKKLIGKYVGRLYKIAMLLEPFMPATSEQIKIAIQENKKPENLFPRKE